MSDIHIVFVTVGKEEEASTLSRKLVEEKLVACVNIIPRIHSVYWWKGEICSEEELLMIMKTRADLLPALQTRIRELHSYEVPEIVAFPIAHGLPEYLDWVIQSTKAQ